LLYEFALPQTVVAVVVTYYFCSFVQVVDGLVSFTQLALLDTVVAGAIIEASEVRSVIAACAG
jgi:hypothetical protein